MKVIRKNYDELAILWAEAHGIVEYRLNGKILIYNVSYPQMGYEPRSTYQFKVDLDTGISSQGVKLKRYDPKGVYNRH